MVVRVCIQVFIIFTFSILVFNCSPDLSVVKDGDIVFQNISSAQNKTLQSITKSKFNNCGVVLSDSTGNLFVYEVFDSVTQTPLTNWIKKGEDKHFLILRLKTAGNILSKGILSKMKKIASMQIGKNYDEQFSWDDSKMYSSELVYKIYFYTTGLQLAETKTLKTFDLSNDTLKNKLQELYHGKIPLTELCVSPQQIMESYMLEKVLED